MTVLDKVSGTFGEGGMHLIGDVGAASVCPKQYDDRYTVLPGFCDVHVHLREPGFSYKETIRSGSLAGARGGYTALCAMPNLDPVPDSAEHLAVERGLIERDACITVRPYGALTVGERGEELADLIGSFGVKATPFRTVADAVETAVRGNDPALAVGSLYMAGEVHQAFREIGQGEQ